MKVFNKKNLKNTLIFLAGVGTMLVVAIIVESRPMAKDMKEYSMLDEEETFNELEYENQKIEEA